MNRLKIVAVLAFSITFASCGNIQGNQSNENPATENNVSKGGAKETKESKVEYLTYESFKENVWDFEASPQEWVYKGTVPCVIDFYADWCKPCKMVAPIMDKLATEYDGEVIIYKIDTDKERKLAGVFGVRSIPMVLFCPTEGKPSKQVGALPESEYKKIIDESLLNKK